MAKQRGVAQAGGVEIEASPHGREDYFNAIGSAGYSFIHHAKLEDAKPNSVCEELDRKSRAGRQ